MEDFIQRAELWPRGNLYEDFTVGTKLNHHWGRTITEADTILFTTVTLSYNPLYFNLDYAKANGHPDIVVNPLLVFNTVVGLSVEDLSEIGGPFLGISNLKYECPVYPGTTVFAASETIDKRLSSRDPRNGIVTWQTRGFDSANRNLLSFKRTNLVRVRNPKS